MNTKSRFWMTACLCVAAFSMRAENAVLPVPGDRPAVLEHLAPLIPPAAKAPDLEHPSCDALELHMRNGLPNFLNKAKTGSSLKVAYFGGSITEANGWRPQTTAWLNQHYPKSQFKEINAAIGGTGSDLGVFRLKRDVLDYKPDLVFVEFAVNDGGAPPEQIYACMEGIVRQIWRANPETDICFVYTLHEGMLSELSANRFPRSAAAMEIVAAHYGIPSIHLAMKAVQKIKSGEWVMTAPKPEVPADSVKGTPAKTAFSPDGCHPFAETGHKLYTEAIVRSFAQLESNTNPGLHPLPAPLVADNHENAKFVPLTSDLLTGNWQALDMATNSIARNFAHRLPVLWSTKTPGAALEFSFHGRYAAVYDLLGPDGGELEVTVDGQPARTVRRFDAYCTYHRLGCTWILSDKGVGDHHVLIRLTSKNIDKVGILKQNKNQMDDPNRFAGLRWYAGALLIDGDLANKR